MASAVDALAVGRNTPSKINYPQSQYGMRCFELAVVPFEEISEFPYLKLRYSR